MCTPLSSLENAGKSHNVCTPFPCRGYAKKFMTHMILIRFLLAGKDRGYTTFWDGFLNILVFFNSRLGKRGVHNFLGYFFMTYKMLRRFLLAGKEKGGYTTFWVIFEYSSVFFNTRLGKRGVHKIVDSQ